MTEINTIPECLPELIIIYEGTNICDVPFRKERNVLTNDGKLMTNRLRNILRYHQVIRIDKKVGEMLLEKLNRYSVDLKTHYQSQSPFDPAAILAEARLAKKIVKTESLYIGLFGPLPQEYIFRFSKT